MTLTEFLRCAAGCPFAWGESDCALFAADWVCERTGRDPAAAVRGRYRTARGARRKYGRSLALFVGRAMRRAGFRMTKHPKPGDVAVIALPGRIVCAIRTETGWAMRLEQGMAWVRSEGVRVVGAWRV